jgi:hypothetical protein
MVVTAAYLRCHRWTAGANNRTILRAGLSLSHLYEFLGSTSLTHYPPVLNLSKRITRP